MFKIGLGPRVCKSPFFDATVAAGVTRFSIYNHMYMPVSYGDIMSEYWRLINDVSVWDVSAERQVEIIGPDAEALTQYLVTRDVSSCKIGQGKYAPLCDHAGRIINDPVLLKLSDNRFWLSLADSDILLWAKAVAAERNYNVHVFEPDASPLAVQGPKAESVITSLFGDWVKELKYFWFKEWVFGDIPLVVARSGWSKQGGYELYLLDKTKGSQLWDKVFEAGKDFNVGAGTPNYIERVESCLLSFGGDTDTDSDPFECGLESYVELNQPDDFIGKAALIEKAKLGLKRKLVGIVIAGTDVQPNPHPLPVFSEDKSVGTIRVVTSSPKFGKNIGLALLDIEYCEAGTEIYYNDDDGRRIAIVTALPFAV